MSNNLVQFNYNGVVIPFMMTGNDVMINATEMVKLFSKKRINDFLSNNQTIELIRQLESETGIPASQLVLVVKGNYSDGRSQGTWMNRKIAIAFAMWLLYSILGVLERLMRLLTRDMPSEMLKYKDYPKKIIIFRG